MAERYREIRYHIEVEHESGDFDSDMDYLTSNAREAYERLQHLEEKYFDSKIKITKIIETKTYTSFLRIRRISKKDLLEEKIRNSL